MDVMEEQVKYKDNNASLEWSHDTLGQILSKFEDESNYRMARERMRSLFLEVVNIEIDRLRQEIRKEFYGSLHEKGIKDVIITVCRYYGCQPEDIETRSRKRQFVEPRQLIAWMIHRQVVPNRMTYEQTAEIFGGYNHATVLHSVKAVDQRIQTETAFRNDIMKMLNEFGYRCTFEDGELKWVLVG